MDPDPGGPKTCGSGSGFGSATLENTELFLNWTTYRVKKSDFLFNCPHEVRTGMVSPWRAASPPSREKCTCWCQAARIWPRPRSYAHWIPESLPRHLAVFSPAAMHTVTLPVASCVTNPRCLSRIRIRIFSISDPNFLHPGSRIRIKEFKYFNPKIVF